MDIESLTKQFTRFFVPGLAFLIFAVTLPATALGKDIFFGTNPAIGATQAVFLSIVIGYVLDSIRGYRFTLSFRDYNAERATLAADLKRELGEESSNPDELLAVLWMRDEANYNRIFVERAEWVMILETSFAMLMSSVLIAGGWLYLHFNSATPAWQLWPASLLMGLMSYLASKNGVERMKAHNRKLVEAVRSIKAANASRAEA